MLALGSTLRGDDGAGPAALALLGQRSLPADVTLLDGGTPALETALLMEGWQRVIVVDAADMGCQPGEWRRLDLCKAQLACAKLNSTLHSAGLPEALALGEALGMLPPTIILYGIQPQFVGWGSGLSYPVEEGLCALCDALVSELAAHGEENFIDGNHPNH